MTPIQRLIKLNPTPVVLRVTPAENAGGQKYNPDDEDDYVPGVPVDTWTHGAFSGVKSDGDEFTATLSLEAIPALMAEDNTRVLLADGDYGVHRIRPRRLRGVISGYTIELTL